MNNARLQSIRLNNCRSTVEEVLTADTLTPALRKGLLHSRQVLAEYVTQLEIDAIAIEVTNAPA